jgi:uncharacterized membrane-anchored protein YhcB (DUF1043 family)
MNRDEKEFLKMLQVMTLIGIIIGIIIGISFWAGLRIGRQTQAKYDSIRAELMKIYFPEKNQ